MSPSPAISPPSNAPSVSTAALVLLLLFSWACLYLVGLGMPELQGEEARRILPGRTMLQTGDWIVPRSAGQVYNRKPPLINWATAASIQLTGRMDEWSARLPSALAMLALALGVLFATRRWLGQGAAFLAACICLTNIGFLEKGRLAEIESIYIACFGLALVSWLGAWWADRRWLAWISAGLFLGVGFLAKGPPHVWYFYALIVGVLAAEGRLKELIRPAHGVGVLAFLLPWVPWALENARRNPQGDSQKVWADQITHRIGFSEFDWSNWLLQIPQSLVNFLPWLLLLPLLWSPAITSQWPQLGRRGSWMRGLRAGLVVGFLVIALLPSSRPRFMLPLNVAAALLVAQFFALLSTDRQARLLRLMTRGFIGIGLLAILAGFGLGLASWQGSARGSITGWIFAILLAVLWIRLAISAWRSTRGETARDIRPLFALGRHALLLLGLAAAIALPGFYQFKSTRDELRPFAAELQRHIGPTDPIVLYKLKERMWPFYLGLRCREIASLGDLPQTTRWVMVEADKAPQRQIEMERRYGPLQEAVAIQEPDTDNAGGNGTRYTLFRFGSAP